MLGRRRKREGEGRHGQRGEKMEEEREGRGTAMKAIFCQDTVNVACKKNSTFVCHGND